MDRVDAQTQRLTVRLLALIERLAAQALQAALAASALAGADIVYAQPSYKYGELPASVASIGEELIDFVEGIGRREPPAFELFRSRVAHAVDSHPDVGSAVDQVGVAEASAREALAGLLPQISGNGDGGYRRYDRNTALFVPSRQQDGFGLGLNARQLLYDFGATPAAVAAGQARQRGAEARLATKRSELALRAITSYIELARARDQLRLAADNATARRSIVVLVRDRFVTGGGSRADVIRAEARLADASATIISAENRVRAAEAAYREAFGEDAGATPMPEDVSIAPAGVPIAELTRRYGGFREGLAAVDAARADTEAAGARMLPNVALEVSATRRDLAGTATPGNDTAVLLVFRYNFYTGGAEAARRDQARQRTQQASQDLAALARQIERSLVQGLAEVRNGEAIVDARWDAVRAAAASLRAVREQFAFNRGTLLDLLRVQEELYIAGRDLIEVIADRAIARYRLLHLASGLDDLFRPAALRPSSQTESERGPR